MEGLRAGRRTIGEVAGHEINLEIEGVQDKIKINSKELKGFLTKKLLDLNKQVLIM